MRHGMTKRKGLGIDQAKRGATVQLLRGGLEQGPDHAREGMQASHPLRIGAQARKGGMIIRRYQPVSLFQTRDPQAALQQGESQYFGISKGGTRMRRLPPVQQVWMSGQKIIDKSVKLGQLIN